MDKKYVLAGDIGATKLVLGVFSAGEKLELVMSSHIRTAECRNLAEPVNQILKEAHEQQGIEIGSAAFGAAGALDKNRKTVKLSNAGLCIDVDGIFTNTLLSQVTLINDVEAFAYSLNVLPKASIRQLSIVFAGRKVLAKPEHDAATALLAPGTGLGAGIITPKGDVLPSEGGQITFAAMTELDWKLVKFLKRRKTGSGFPINESLISGPGLESIYDFLKTQNVKSKFENEICKSPDRAEKISFYAGRDTRCRAALGLLFRYCGRAAADIAMLALPYAGIYLGGGVAVKNIGWESSFSKGFTENLGKGTRSEILPRIPVFVVDACDAPLYGAAYAAVKGEKCRRRQ